MKIYKPVLALVLATVFMWAVFPAAGLKFLDSPSVAAADEDWKKEFDDLCAKTQDAMAYSPDELKGFIDRCDKLKPKIEALDETQRKVYMKRLQRCRDLFSFTLESKEAKQP